MPRIGLSMGQGTRVARPIPAPPSITVYEDTLSTFGAADARFLNRQWFSSHDAVSVHYGEYAGVTSDGVVGVWNQSNKGLVIYSGATKAGRHALVHFDCLKEQYPTFSNGTSYQSGGILSATGVDAGSFSNGTFPIIQGGGSGGVITVLNGVISVTSAGTGYVDGSAVKAGGSRYNLVTGQVVYGGVYGHGLYRKTSSSVGYPIFTAPSNAQDASGWTRYRPAMRTIEEGKALNIRFKIEVINPLSTFFSASNSLRIGLFGDGGGNFINYDDVGPISSDFSLYTGYMIGIGKNHTILKRVPSAANTNLILSSGAFTGLASTPMTFNVTQNPFLPPRNLWPILQVDLTIGKSGGNAYINSIVTGHLGNGDVTQGIEVSNGDTPDALNFNTLVVGAPSNIMDAFKITDVKIIYR